MMVRASIRGFAQAMQTQPAPYRAPARASPHAATAFHPRIGRDPWRDTCNALVDLASTMPQQSRDKICLDGAAFIACSLSGQTLRVLGSRGTQPELATGLGRQRGRVAAATAQAGCRSEWPAK